jgi:hypothetical protein
VGLSADEPDRAFAGKQIPQTQLVSFFAGPLESTTLAGRSNRP